MKADAGTRRRKVRSYLHTREFRLDAALLFVGMLAGRVVLLGGVTPFAPAFLAAAGMCGSAHAALIGVLIGSLALQGAPDYAAAAVCALYYVLYLVWDRLRRDFGKFSKLILLFVSQAALMPVFYRGTLQRALQGLICIGISSLAALVMQNAIQTLRVLKRRQVLTDGEQLSISATFGVLLLGVTDVAAFGFSLPVALLLLFAMAAVQARGVAGVAVAVALAAMLGTGGKFTLSFMGGVAVCALAGAALRSLGSLGVLGGFVCCSLFVGTYAFTSAHTINLINLVIAGAGFLLFPKERMEQLCAYLDADKSRERFARKANRRMRAVLADELRQTAAVSREIAGMYRPVETGGEPSDALLQWMAQAARSACGDCPLKIPCWKEKAAAEKAVFAMAEMYERGERVQPVRPLDLHCRHLPQIAVAAYHARSQNRASEAQNERTNRQYAFLYRQMMGLSEILTKLSERVLVDRWLDEETEEMLLRGFDRRGMRVYGVDASYPGGRLLLRIRVPLRQMQDMAPFVEAVERITGRGIRVLHAEPEAKQCTLVMEEAQQLTASMGTATVPVSRSGVSGDAAGERRMERGRVLYAISDGMGAGEAARGESDSALRLLFDLYDAGFSREVALESVNRLLLERDADMYATLDAVYLDLRTGEAAFMKYGAPPSFVMRGGKMYVVSAEALPAGILSEAVPAVSTAKLRRNDAVFLLSDGALDALGSDTQTAIWEAVKRGKTTQEAAQALLHMAEERGQSDDMTVMVIQIA